MQKKTNLPYVNIEETIANPPGRLVVEKVVRKLADRTISDTVYGFRYKDKLFQETGNLPVSTDVSLASGYIDWKYWNGVINTGMQCLGKELSETKYIRYPVGFFNFAFANLEFFKDFFSERIADAPFHQYFRMDRLDDCGALGASLIECFDINDNPEYHKRIVETAEYLRSEQDRLEDGTFARRRFGRTTLWADDLYMSVPFLAKYSQLSGDKSYLEDAILQVKNFHRRLFSTSYGLYHHCWYQDSDNLGVAYWGRANGWVAMAICELIDHMQETHPEREEIIKILLRQITGFARYQSASGMWRQLLDKTDAWEESSVTAMFTYAVSKAVNKGWINNIYSSIAVNGWMGLEKCISPAGELDRVSTGFNIKQDLPFYYNIPIEPGGAHGIGAVLLAAAEMMKLTEYRDCLWC